MLNIKWYLAFLSFVLQIFNTYYDLCVEDDAESITYGPYPQGYNLVEKDWNVEKAQRENIQITTCKTVIDQLWNDMWSQLLALGRNKKVEFDLGVAEGRKHT